MKLKELRKELIFKNAKEFTMRCTGSPWSIRKNDQLNIYGNVQIHLKENGEKLPCKIGTIYGDFIVIGNLTSLENFPDQIEGFCNFYKSSKNKFTREDVEQPPTTLKKCSGL